MPAETQPWVLRISDRPRELAEPPRPLGKYSAAAPAAHVQHLRVVPRAASSIDCPDDAGRLGPARGIVIGLAISAAAWAVMAFAVWLLL